MACELARSRWEGCAEQASCPVKSFWPYFQVRALVFVPERNMALVRILRVLSAHFHGNAVCLSLRFLPVCPTTSFHSGEGETAAFCKGRIFHKVFVVGVNCGPESPENLVALIFAFPGISGAGCCRCEQRDRNETGRNVFDFVCRQFGFPFGLQLLISSIPSCIYCEIIQELQPRQQFETALFCLALP